MPANRAIAEAVTHSAKGPAQARCIKRRAARLVAQRGGRPTTKKPRVRAGLSCVHTSALPNLIMVSQPANSTGRLAGWLHSARPQKKPRRSGAKRSGLTR